MGRLRWILAGALIIVLAHAPKLSAQEIRGRVVGVDSAAISSAVVEVLETGRYARTRSDGRFRLSAPPGEWRLRTSAVGYRSDTTLVVLRDGGRHDVRITLAPAPLELRGISVASSRAVPFASTVTRETVRQVPALAEPDLFRAVVLLPQVSQPNDLKGRIHLAGGASDETGVRLDGHPLQDPFHLLGLFGAFNTAALQRADVLVHHLPPGLGGRLSGVIDLDTRDPGPGTRGEAVGSLLSAGGAASRPIGGFDVLASGRVTYLDRVAPLVMDGVPRLGFADGLLRVGHDFGSHWRAEAIGFATRDYFRSEDAASLRAPAPFRWGESLVGFRVDRVGGEWDAALRVSRNRAYVRLDERPGEPNRIRSERGWLSAAAEVVRRGTGWRAEAGVGVDRRDNRQEWVARGLIDEIFSPATPETFEGSAAQTIASVFGGAGIGEPDGTAVFVGARVSALEGALYAAPRIMARIRLSEHLRSEFAANRRYQFDAQLEEPIEGSVTAPLFLIAAPRRADVLAASLDWTPATPPVGILSTFRLQGFLKRYPDLPRLPERVPGQGREASPGFPEFERVSGYGAGASISGRIHFANDGLIQGSYTYQRVRERFDDELVPTSWDAPHTLVLFGSAPVWRGFRVNAAYHAHSGRATTPVTGLTFEPDLRLPNSSHLLPRYLFGDRNSIRVPPYHRIDVGVRKSGSWRHGTWTLFAQVLNLLDRENPVGYDWQAYFSEVQSGRRNAARAGRGGLPFLPSIGVELRW